MSHSILIVDDDAEIRDVLCAILGSEGFDVLTAADGVLALDLLANQKVDLLIVDVMMPRLNGIEVCKAVRGMDWATAVPIFMISADSSHVTQAACLDAGATRYFVKPMAIDVFVEMVQAVLPVASTP